MSEIAEMIEHQHISGGHRLLPFKSHSKKSERHRCTSQYSNGEKKEGKFNFKMWEENPGELFKGKPTQSCKN